MTGVVTWDEWLAHPDCRHTLESAARFVYRQALRLALPPNLLPCSNPWTLDDDQRRDCFAALANELWIFLATRPLAWRQKQVFQQLAALGPRFVLQRIVQDYLQHIAAARRSGSCPRCAATKALRSMWKPVLSAMSAWLRIAGTNSWGRWSKR